MKKKKITTINVDKSKISKSKINNLPNFEINFI